MPKFGAESLRQRDTLHPDLQMILDDAILLFDFAIIEGWRNKTKQDAAVASGASQTPWPRSKHNVRPSRAADLAPYPVDWKEGEKPHLRFAFLMGVIHACARRRGVNVRFGMDWNRNLDPRDESFLDYGHVELYP